MNGHFLQKKEQEGQIKGIRIRSSGSQVKAKQAVVKGSGLSVLIGAGELWIFVVCGGVSLGQWGPWWPHLSCHS